MYDVFVYNDNEKIHINGERIDAGISGTFTEEKNAIPSFEFDILKNNPGFNKLNEYITRAKIFDKEKCVFNGRVILVNPSYDSSGTSSKKVTCEGVLGYLNDTFAYPYIETLSQTDITILNAVKYLIDYHNNQVGKNSRKYVEFNPTYECEADMDKVEVDADSTTFTALTQEAFTDEFDIQLLEKNDKLVLELYREKSGDFGLSLDVNMQSVSINPTFELCTRVIPVTSEGYGMGEHGASMEATDYYVEDSEAIKRYGVITKVHKFENVKKISKLKSKAQKWLAKNSKIKRSVSVTGLDLYDLGITPNQFEIGQKYTIRCDDLNLNEQFELRKITRDINETWNAQLEFGEKNFSVKRYIKANKIRKGINL